MGAVGRPLVRHTHAGSLSCVIAGLLLAIGLTGHAQNPAAARESTPQSTGVIAGVVVIAGRGRGDWRSGGASRLLGGLRAWLHMVRRIGQPDHDHAMNVLTLPEAAFENSEFGMRNSEFPTAHPGSAAPSEDKRERREKNVTAL